MMAKPASIDRIDEHGIVLRPVPGEAVGAALRGIYSDGALLPDDMLRMLNAMDRHSRGH